MEIYVNALVKKCESDRATAVANLNTYLQNQVGVGEHPDIVQEMEKLLDLLHFFFGFMERLKIIQDLLKIT